MRKILLLIGLILLIGLGGCSRDSSETPEMTAGSLDKDPILDGDYTMVEGDFGTGSMYRLYCPNDWNGELVVYAHGYAMPDEDPALPVEDELRDALLAEGYGMAYSSYSEVGWAVHVGMNETRQLRGLFSGAFHRPEKTYIMGKSMGGLITVALSERNHNLYDGAVPLCGAVGGGRMALDYVYTVRALFDYFYPDVLPGDAQNVPADLHYSTAMGLAQAAMVANPYPAMEMGNTLPANIQWDTPEELIEAIVWGVAFQTATFADMMERTHNHPFFDNSDVYYSGSGDDIALNDGIDRFTSHRAAEAFIRTWYQPTGKQRIPTVTLHTTRDPVVQIFQEEAYAAAVEDAGYSDNLHQITIDRFGHCVFTVDEVMAAFHQMLDMTEVEDERGGNNLQR